MSRAWPAPSPGRGRGSADWGRPRAADRARRGWFHRSPPRIKSILGRLPAIAGQMLSMLRRRHVFFIITALFSLTGVALVGPRNHVAADNLPKQLSDRAFWKLVTDFSEPEGSF